MSEILTAAQKQGFARDGFLCLRGFFDAAETQELIGWTKEVADWPEVPGRHMVYHEEDRKHPGAKVIQRIEDFVPFHAGFRALFLQGRMYQAVSELLGEEAVLFKEKINFKMPGGAGFTPHQDAQAGWSIYAPFFITCLVSIDAATVENGCLEVAPGFHRKGLIGAEWKPLTEADMAGMDFQAFPTAPGDALFFDSFAPHKSGPNDTQDPRRVLYVTYNKTSDGDHRARYFADKRKSFPPDIERDPTKTYVFKV